MAIDTSLDKGLKKVEADAEAAAGTEKGKSGLVAVDKKALEGLVARLDQQTKDIEMLKLVADKARMQSFESKNADFSTKIVKVSLYNGKLVVAWKTTKDEIYQDSQSRWHESQKMMIVLEGGEEHEMEYIDFVKKLVKVDAELITKYTTPKGEEMYRMNLNGREIDIDRTFVN